MRFGRASAYALLGMICLAQQADGATLSVCDIARVSGVPLEYLRKILQILTHAGLVRSERGRNGGFDLAHPASRITLRRIIEAVEGPIESTTILDIEPPADASVRVHAHLRRWRAQAARDMRHVLEQTTLAKLVGL